MKASVTRHIAAYAAPSDRVAFEIGSVELQRVNPDHHTGWSVVPLAPAD